MGDAEGVDALELDEPVARSVADETEAWAASAEAWVVADDTDPWVVDVSVFVVAFVLAVLALLALLADAPLLTVTELEPAVDAVDAVDWAETLGADDVLADEVEIDALDAVLDSCTLTEGPLGLAGMGPLGAAVDGSRNDENWPSTRMMRNVSGPTC